MNKKQDKNINDKIYRTYSFNQAGMLVQIILVFFILVFAVISLFNSKFLPACEITAGLALLVMGYNNHMIYKRKKITILYIIIGIATLISGIVSLIK